LNINLPPNLLIQFDSGTEEQLNLLPISIKKLKIKNLNYPLNNLPPYLEEFYVDYYSDVIDKCKIPFGCTVKCTSTCH
jgi:hypothetical protein